MSWRSPHPLDHVSHGFQHVLLHGTDRNSQAPGDLGVTHVFEPGEKKHVPGPLRQLEQGRQQQPERLPAFEHMIGREIGDGVKLVVISLVGIAQAHIGASLLVDCDRRGRLEEVTRDIGHAGQALPARQPHEHFLRRIFDVLLRQPPSPEIPMQDRPELLRQRPDERLIGESDLLRLVHEFGGGFPGNCGVVQASTLGACPGNEHRSEGESTASYP